jgi:hypothetical protein
MASFQANFPGVDFQAPETQKKAQAVFKIALLRTTLLYTARLENPAASDADLEELYAFSLSLFSTLSLFSCVQFPLTFLFV